MVLQTVRRETVAAEGAFVITLSLLDHLFLADQI